MTDGFEASDELIEMFRVCDVTESWRESVLGSTEGAIGALVVAPMLCNTFDDTRGTVSSVGLKKITHQLHQRIESGEAYFEEVFELFFNAKPPTPPPMAPATNTIDRSSESQKVGGRKPSILGSSTRRGTLASLVALWQELG